MGHDVRRPPLSPRRSARLNLPPRNRDPLARLTPGAARESAPSTAARIFYAKIELLFFVGHLYVPDVSFAPHQ
ncbi:hypothetical protein DB771_19440 [Burkholderia sp. AU29985]|nr:hypothetical protein EGY28_23640 [Burkholderia dolosa]PRE41821.1 hypothetical protein C6P87_27540 [Burkholderia sp. AU12872]PUA75254.1 hypothetical protein DB771_19440 [Burkholderia sp. AU29985]